ncbi:VacJ-like lipoprotein [invertebrate metagenome]|uniref:VacJ-like lipoprotein n=1 Tax=invertebrate metagenome TaxID=1711999 RepID=A0A484H558_9ZZZZ
MKRTWKLLSFYIVILLLTDLIAGCAGVPSVHDPDAVVEYQQANDPAEPTNRVVFHVNRGVNTMVFKPAARGYRAVPHLLRDMIHNFLTNWREPLVFIHDMLQGEFKRAGETAARFATNTALGFFGVGDVALAGLNIPHHDEDMGQTLAVWNVREGPYIVLPLFGPSNARDAVGRLVDCFLDPISLVTTIPTAASIGKMSVSGIDHLERHLDMLDDLERTSLDYYVSLRTLYRQHRAAEISNGRYKMIRDDLSYDSAAPKALLQSDRTAYP